jgi:hypothetical protein
MFLDYNYNVWISSDSGAKWKKADDVPENVAAALYKHPFSDDKVSFFYQKKRNDRKIISLI